MSNSPRKSDSKQPEPRPDRSGIIAVAVIIAMGLLLIFGFDFLAGWLGRLFSM